MAKKNEKGYTAKTVCPFFVCPHRGGKDAQGEVLWSAVDLACVNVDRAKVGHQLGHFVELGEVHMVVQTHDRDIDLLAQRALGGYDAVGLPCQRGGKGRLVRQDHVRAKLAGTAVRSEKTEPSATLYP